MRTLWPTPCSGEPTPPSGMCFSIISRVTKPVPCVQPSGALLRTCCCQLKHYGMTEEELLLT